jgi:P27 family predicted phage terminase small subunit
MALDEIAMREWRRLAGVLRERNALHEIDHGSLAAYCQMYSRWVAAEKALARMAELDPVAGGLMIKTSNGNAIQNPLVGIANKAAAAMVKYAGEFGMTPNSRGQRFRLGSGEMPHCMSYTPPSNGKKCSATVASILSFRICRLMLPTVGM